MAKRLLVELLGQRLVRGLRLDEDEDQQAQADEKDVDASDGRDHAQQVLDDEPQAQTLPVQFRVEYELRR